MKEITSEVLKQWMSKNENFQLIDVREKDENEQFNIGGELMPLSSFSAFIENIDRDKPVVMYCRSGVRSAQAINYLSKELDFDNLINLKGGILNWV